MGTDRFPTTQSRLVFLAGEGFTERSHAALAELCRIYWYPLYAFVRRQGYDSDQAQDLTQAFFARLLEKQYLRDYERQRGRFRSFLLAAMKHFLANERDRAHAQKRGDGIAPLPLNEVIQAGEVRYSLEPRSDLTPEAVFERQWARSLLQQALSRIEDEAVQGGKQEQFERLKGYLTGDDKGIPYSQAATDLGLGEGAVKVAIHRMRSRFRDVLREEIARTVSQPDEIEEEIRFLMSVVATPL